MKMQKTLLSLLIAATLLLGLAGCGTTLPVTQFQDVRKQSVTKDRAVFDMDVSLYPIIEKEGITPRQAVSIKSYGRVYVSAVGFKNLYCITPKGTKTAACRVVKLKRDSVLPFSRVVFEWAANDEITFKWQDTEGVHTNVINKKGKASL